MRDTNLLHQVLRFLTTVGLPVIAAIVEGVQPWLIYATLGAILAFVGDEGGTPLRRLGYSSEEQTGHGFRSMASTLLNEQGFPPDVIELQLAHTERNKVRAAYNKAQRLPERRKMMQAWADYLDVLRAGGNVVPFERPLP